MTDARIRLDSVSKVFPDSDTPAVDRLSLEVPSGSVTTLVGPSGCGKTTTLKMINRIIEPTRGTVWIGDVDAGTVPPPELRRGIGYVIQQVGLFPHRTIGQNIATVPALLGWEKPRTEARVSELAELVGLDTQLLDRYPPELSGGQQQRVGVARALAADPPILLMDEPFGAVDPIVRSRLQDELQRLQDRLNKTIVFVTHDIDEAIKLGDRVAILNTGAALEQYAPPDEILASPANEFVADFLGQDRGIKRLSLRTVSDIELVEGPVVAWGETAAEARVVMERWKVDWVAVSRDGPVVGWLGDKDLDTGVEPRAFQTKLSPTATLRDALDAIVTSSTRVAAVFSGDRYLGMVSLNAITREIIG